LLAPPPAPPVVQSPVIQRAVTDAPAPERPPLTTLTRPSDTGPLPDVPSYRTLPLLPARPLAHPAPAPQAVRPVARAVWRRTADHTAAPASPVTRPPVRPGAARGVDIVAMAPKPMVLQRESARQSPAMPVAPVQRIAAAANPPSAASGSASPAVFSQPPPTSTVVPRTPETPARSGPQRQSTVDTVNPAELDRLARQLFEPVSRLLRADLRRGRERAGHGQDRRH
jgi:syndecan 1